jgi:hypothetical protein
MTMPALDRGQKHVCLSCQTPFYDLKRPKISCPRCGLDQEEARIAAAAAAKSKKAKAKAALKAAPVVKVEEAPLVDDGEDDDVDDDADDTDDDVELEDEP